MKLLLHLGVHRTATTALQNSLQRRPRMLRDRYQADWKALASGTVAGVDVSDPLDEVEAAT